MTVTHHELHQPAEAVPDDQVPAAAALLRQFVRKSGIRTFHSCGIASGDPDLGTRAKEIIRKELGGTWSIISCEVANPRSIVRLEP